MKFKLTSRHITSLAFLCLVVLGYAACSRTAFVRDHTVSGLK